MYKARVRDDFEFDLDSNDIKLLDVIPLNDGTYHVNLRGKLFTIELLDLEQANKVYTLKVNGHTIQVDVDDKYELLVREMGMDKINQHQQNKINAPMPGMVSSVAVSEGQSVDIGTPLIILEAMKMENVLKSPMQGKIKRIYVKPGEAVDKNTLLVEID